MMGKLSTESAFSEYHRADFSINVACRWLGSVAWL